MKKILLPLYLFAHLAIAAHAGERDDAVAYLEKTRDALVEATKGLSEEQWRFKSAPERWSVAETLEHIAAAEDYILNNIAETVMQAPARGEEANLAEIDALILAAVPDRSQKFQAPEPLMPINRFEAPKSALKEFKKRRAKTIAFLKKTEGLRDHATDSPLGQQLDAHQWILFLAAHSERHTKQILEVKADPAFPKK